jgi:hypothetical protein
MTLKVETAVTSSHNQQAIDLAKSKHIEGAPITFGELMSVLDYATLNLSDRREIAILYDMDSKDVTAAVKGYVKNNGLRTALGSVPKDEYEFVDALLDKWKTRMTFQGMFTIDTPYDIGGGIFATKDELELLSAKDQIKVMYSDPKNLTLKHMLAEVIFQNRKLGLTFNEKELTNALEKWVKRRKDDISSNMMTEVAYEGIVFKEMIEPEWDRFIKAITNTNPEETKIVLKHFIWQVKRKMFGLSVTYHMMPVFFGPQEAGKSTVVRDFLCKPIKDFFASTDFATITDNRSHDIWDNYVLFFDEMGRSAVSHLEDIKRKITEDTFNSRVLGKNADTLVVNRATFIGTTNKDISRLIFDDTGMRRFYQVDCLPKLDWTVTQNINYLNLWRSVDERAETPLLDDAVMLGRVKRVQSSKRQITMIEKWLRERNWRPFVQEKVMAQAFFEEFVKFEQENSGNGRSEMTHTKFGRDIKDIAMNIPGLELNKRGTNKGTTYMITYQIDVNRDIEDLSV